MGVEPTILAAKDRINGFEGHENHRIPFASANDYRDGDGRVQLFAGSARRFLAGDFEKSRRVSAHFEVCAVALGAYLTARQQLAHKTFADDDWLESVAKGTSPKYSCTRSLPHGIGKLPPCGASEISRADF